MAEASRKREASTPVEMSNNENPKFLEVPQQSLLNGEVYENFNKKLEREYGEDWKTADKIHMIPCVFVPSKATKDSKKGAEAEREVYKALQGLNNKKTSTITTYLTNSKNCSGFVYHDQTFSEEEVDFVYVSIHGLLVIECKAVNRKAQVQAEYEGAYSQLERKVPVLLRTLGLPKDNIPIFKVVAFPLLSHCDVQVRGETRCLFKNDMKDLKNWLRRLNFIKESNAMCFETYVGIAEIFLLKYHSSRGKITNFKEFKKRAIADCSDSLERYYTKEQAKILNLTRFEDMWIIGAAGTGKTLVLKDLVGKLTQACSKNYKGKPLILVITYNTPINKEIELWIKDNPSVNEKLVRVQTFSALLGHIFIPIENDLEEQAKVQHKKMADEDKVQYILRGKFLERYFSSKYTNTSKFLYILVDEAQDLPGEWLTLLDAMLNQRAKSFLRIFEDPFQTVRRNATRPDNDRFTKHRLTKVFRNPHSVFEAYVHVYESLKDEVIAKNVESFSDDELSPPSIFHDVYGMAPKYINAETENQLKTSLVSTLKELQMKGVLFSDVAVITLNKHEAEKIRKYLMCEQLNCDDADHADRCTEWKNSPKRANPPVIVDTYQRFKGLESKVLIFLVPSCWEPRNQDIYVSFSRSFCYLVVIANTKVIEYIKRCQNE